MDKFIGIELDRFGFSIDSEWLYISIDYKLIFILAGLIIARRIYLKQFK